VVLRRLLPQVLLTATQSGVSPRAVKVAVAVIATGFIYCGGWRVPGGG
jgi:hypothetical protein